MTALQSLVRPTPTRLLGARSHVQLSPQALNSHQQVLHRLLAQVALTALEQWLLVQAAQLATSAHLLLPHLSRAPQVKRVLAAPRLVLQSLQLAQPGITGRPDGHHACLAKPGFRVLVELLHLLHVLARLMHLEQHLHAQAW